MIRYILLMLILCSNVEAHQRHVRPTRRRCRMSVRHIHQLHLQKQREIREARKQARSRTRMTYNTYRMKMLHLIRVRQQAYYHKWRVPSYESEEAYITSLKDIAALKSKYYRRPYHVSPTILRTIEWRRRMRNSFTDE